MRSTTRAESASSSARCCVGFELVVDEQHVRVASLRNAVLQLVELALADVGPRIGRGALLDELADRLDARGPRELAQLAQLVLGVGALREHGEHEARARAPRPACGSGSAGGMADEYAG